MNKTVSDIKDLIEDLGRAHGEFVAKNNQRLQEIEKKGHADPALENQVNRIAGQIQSLAETKGRLEFLETRLNRPNLGAYGSTFDPEAELKKQAVNKYLRTGESRMTAEEIKHLASDSDPEGGYWVTSDMSMQVVTQVRETSPMRNVATVETISSDALEIPEDIDEADAGWTSERAARTETTAPTIGVRRIPVHELYAEPRATQTLLDDARIDIESWLAGKIADKMARLENAAFINGDGVGKPRGILTYPAGTTNPGEVEQVNSGNASALTADGLRAAAYALKSPYSINAHWLMSRGAIEDISKLKDADNQYLWQPGLQFGEPETLLGHPIERMEDMPAVAANSLSVAFGDFKQAYTIVDRLGIRVLRDPFSAKPFVLFYATKRTGGEITNFEAYVIQKTAA